MNADKALIHAISELLPKYPTARRAALFGSRARGDNTERSDYDIAVYGDISTSDKLQMRSAFREELPTLHKIDLVFVNEIGDAGFLKSIEQEGVIFYDAENSDEAR